MNVRIIHTYELLSTPFLKELFRAGPVPAPGLQNHADQRLHSLGREDAGVVAAETGNFENPDHPEFEDYGHVSFRSRAGTVEATVTFYSGKQSPGFLLDLEGAEGRMGYRVDSRLPRLVDDVLNRTKTAMPQAHAFLASDLAVRAQLMAVRLKGNPETKQKWLQR